MVKFFSRESKNIVGEALREWAEAVNNRGSFGTWRRGVTYNSSDVSEKSHKAIRSENSYYH